MNKTVHTYVVLDHSIMPAVACPFPGCEYITVDLDAAIVTALTTAHSTTYTLLAHLPETHILVAHLPETHALGAHLPETHALGAHLSETHALVAHLTETHALGSHSTTHARVAHLSETHILVAHMSELKKSNDQQCVLQAQVRRRGAVGSASDL